MPIDWKYPMKPVPVTKTSLERLDLSQYTMEVKLDGWRAVVVAEESGARLWTRQKTPIKTPRNLQEQIRAIGLPPGTVLDGEIWNPEKRGGWDLEADQPCYLTLWDCVWSGRRDLSDRPIEERRAALTELLGGGTGQVVQLSPLEVSTETVGTIEADARTARLMSSSRSGYVHGIVFKRRTSPRRDHSVKSKEHPDWLKLVFDGMKGWESSP